MFLKEYLRSCVWMHLHTGWGVLLHQEPAGAMEAELAVRIWTVPEVRVNGSCQRVCDKTDELHTSE